MIRRILAGLFLALWATGAHAAICSTTLPFTLTNGSVADASQVMANYNAIISCVNSGAANSGVNTNITALSGITTPVTPGQGGTNVFQGTGVGGSANAITISTATPNSFSLTTFNQMEFLPTAANTGATTLQVGALAATNIYKQGPSGPIALVGGEIQSGQIVKVIYDGAEFVLMNPSSALSVYTGSGSGFVNKIRNGSGLIAQRGTSVTITAGTPAYTMDGWYVNSVGANVTVSQSTGNSVSPFTFWTPGSIQIAGQVGVTGGNIYQRIESVEAAGLRGARVTFQANIYNPGGSSFTPTLSVVFPTATDNYASTTALLTGQSLQTIPAATGAVVAYTFDIPNNTNPTNGMQVLLDWGNTLNGAGALIKIAGVDLRITPGVPTGLNNNPPLPEIPTYAAELARNQRYYYDPANGGSTPVFYSQNSPGAGTGSLFMVYYPVRMRAAPTITTRNIIYGNGSALTTSSVNTSAGFGAGWTATAGGSSSVQFNITASAEI